MANLKLFPVLFIFLLVILLTNVFTSVLGYEDEDNADNNSRDNPDASNDSLTSELETVPQPEPEPEIEAFEFVNVTPRSVKQGDVLLSISFRNTGTAKLRNLLPVVVARGFSTYDVVPIPILRKRDVGTAFVSGKVDEPGDLLLTIKVGEQVFYDRITVLPVMHQESLEEKQLKEEQKRKSVLALSQQLQDLKTKYIELESQYITKKDKYDVAGIQFQTLRSHIQNAQTKLLNEDLNQANISIVLAYSEYQDQHTAIVSAPKKALLLRMKDNVLLISGIAAGIITLFTFYEFMKKKQEHLTQRIGEKISDIKLPKPSTVKLKLKSGAGKEQKSQTKRAVKETAKEKKSETPV